MKTLEKTKTFSLLSSKTERLLKDKVVLNYVAGTMLGEVFEVVGIDMNGDDAVSVLSYSTKEKGWKLGDLKIDEQEAVSHLYDNELELIGYYEPDFNDKS